MAEKKWDGYISVVKDNDIMSESHLFQTHFDVFELLRPYITIMDIRVIGVPIEIVRKIDGMPGTSVCKKYED